MSTSQLILSCIHHCLLKQKSIRHDKTKDLLNCLQHLSWFTPTKKKIHMVRHLHCVFINYNWINQLSNTTMWRLDICCLLHRYQLHVSALTAIFRLIDWQQTCKQLYFGMRLVCGGGGLGLDGGTRSHVCWVDRVMWVHGYYCAGNL
jgi:hypothetical protein